MSEDKPECTCNQYGEHAPNCPMNFYNWVEESKRELQEIKKIVVKNPSCTERKTRMDTQTGKIKEMTEKEIEVENEYRANNGQPLLVKLKNLPKANCAKCGGTGSTGRNIDTGLVQVLQQFVNYVVRNSSVGLKSLSVRYVQ